MGALAGMLKGRGFHVTGSDQNVYPPMSTQLAAQQIPVMVGYKAENLQPRPDLVIVGNALSRGNPEIEALLESGIPYVSYPEALSKFFITGKHSIVIAGTHGKTTTCSLAAAVLDHAGENPSFLIGGVPLNFGLGQRLSAGKHFVVEGDEYDTAFFDKESKFLHYQPKTAIVTSVEFDHADIFRDLDHVKAAFRKFVGLIPKDGLLVYCADDAGAVDVSTSCTAPKESYGLKAKADWTVANLAWKDGRATFDVMKRGAKIARIESPLLGEHNLANTLGVIAALHGAGIAPEKIAAGVKAFQGVKRRQEVRGEKNGITVLDDFAHHPTAVKVTLDALRAGFPGRRLWAIFEPRSATSRRKVFQQQYAEAFGPADKIVIADVYLADKLSPELRFDPKQLAADIRTRGKDAVALPSADEIVKAVLAQKQPGDVIAVLSNGGFDNIHEKLLAGL